MLARCLAKLPEQILSTAPVTTMVTALLVENEFFIPLDSFFHSASNGVINLIVLLIKFDLLKENKIL